MNTAFQNWPDFHASVHPFPHSLSGLLLLGESEPLSPIDDLWANQTACLTVTERERERERKRERDRETERERDRQRERERGREREGGKGVSTLSSR